MTTVRRTFADKIITIERYILDQQLSFPDATGTLTNLLYDVALAAKIISRHMRRAGLVDILGDIGTTNVQGETGAEARRVRQRTIIRLQ